MTPAQPKPSTDAPSSPDAPRAHVALRIERDSLGLGLIFGAVLVFLAAIGTLTAFKDKAVITDTLTLTYALLIGLVGGAGYMAGNRAGSRDAPALAANGAITGGMVGAILALFKLLADRVDLRGVFPNISPQLLELLNFSVGGAGALAVMLVGGAALGTLGALATLPPRRVQAITTFTVLITLLMGLLQDQLRDMVNLTDSLLVAAWAGVGYALAGATGRPLAARVDGAPVRGNESDQLRKAVIRSAIGGAIAGMIVVVLLDFTPPASISRSVLIEGLWFGQPSPAVSFLLILAASTLFALAGALLSVTPKAVHNMGLAVVVALLILGVAQARGGVTIGSALVIAALVVLFQLLARTTSAQAQSRNSRLSPAQQRTVRLLTGVGGFLLLLIVPQISNLYINSVLDQVGLYILMGLGLNIVVGYAGLLDLGYVAFFTIGAYMTGILTTPNAFTCPPPRDNVVVVQQARADEGVLESGFRRLARERVGVVARSDSALAAAMIRRAEIVEYESTEAAIDALLAGEVAAVVDHQDTLAPFVAPNGLAMSTTFTPNRDAWRPSQFTPQERAARCSTILPFWLAWPFAGLVAGLAGVLLGIPVLRMRGDYLAIVTLGFGEIIRILALSDDLADYLGGAQGVTEIPSPIINLSALGGRTITLASASEIYYLILISVLLVAFIAYRLSHSRLGRAWMSMREDEDVAQATGINLVNTKLLAFSIGAIFSGIGGAVFATWLHSIFPNSFTLLVSINVLSLIIIGGLASIPGVVVGAFALVGLPEILREFSDYRLLVFGALLVVMMVLRPEGLIPAPTRRLEFHEDVEPAAEPDATSLQETPAPVTEGGD